MYFVDDLTPDRGHECGEASVLRTAYLMLLNVEFRIREENSRALLMLKVVMLIAVNVIIELHCVHVRELQLA